MTFDLFKYIEEEVEADRPEGKGLITKVQVIGGWYIFGTGPSEDRFFEFTDEETGLKAKEAALALIDKNGMKNQKGEKARPFLAIRMRTYGKGFVLNRDKDFQWEHIDKYLVHFSDDYQKIFQEFSLENWHDGYVFGDDIWVRLGYKQSIDRPTWKTEDGEERQNMVSYIVEVYKDRDEADAAAEALDNDGLVIEIPKRPAKYLYDDWNDFYRSMVNEFMIESPDEDLVAGFYELGDYGVTEAMIEHAMDQAKRLLESSEIPF